MSDTYVGLNNLTSFDDDDYDEEDSHLWFDKCNMPILKFSSSSKLVKLRLFSCNIDLLICPPKLTDLRADRCKIKKIICNNKLVLLRYDPIDSYEEDTNLIENVRIENVPSTLTDLAVHDLLDKLPDSVTNFTCSDECAIKLVLNGTIENHKNLHALNNHSPVFDTNKKLHKHITKMISKLMLKDIPFERLKDLYIDCLYGFDGTIFKKSKDAIETMLSN